MNSENKTTSFFFPTFSTFSATYTFHPVCVQMLIYQKCILALTLSQLPVSLLSDSCSDSG